jgi:hypothetical protein
VARVVVHTLVRHTKLQVEPLLTGQEMLLFPRHHLHRNASLFEVARDCDKPGAADVWGRPVCQTDSRLRKMC